jgi:hypothetical protein
MAETSTTRVQQLQTALLPWQRQHDLLLWYVRMRVIELDQMGARVAVGARRQPGGQQHVGRARAAVANQH